MSKKKDTNEIVKPVCVWKKKKRIVTSIFFFFGSSVSKVLILPLVIQS